MLSSYIVWWLLVASTLERGNSVHPKFVNTQQNVSAVLGRDAHLNCSVVGAGEFKVAWIGMSRGTVLSVQEDKVYDHPRVDIRHSSSSTGIDSFILTFKDITQEDTGSYLCQVNTQVALRRIYTLSLVVPPSIQDDLSKSDTEVPEGGTARLFCKANGTPEPTITWRREDSSLIRVGGGIELPVEGEELKLLNVDRSYAGAYLCIATNGVPPSVSKRIQLNVRFKPKIKADFAVIESQIGDDAEVSCVVDGFPKPNMIWTETNGIYHPSEFTDTNFMQGDRFHTSVSRISDNKHKTTLRIKKVQLQDFRSYKCFANNSEGFVESSVSLREIVTTTTTTTTTSSTSTTASTTSPFPTHRPTRSHVDGKSPIELSNRTRGDKMYPWSTPHPQKSYYSDQHKHSSENRRKKNNEAAAMDKGSKSSIFTSSSRGRSIYSNITFDSLCLIWVLLPRLLCSYFNSW